MVEVPLPSVKRSREGVHSARFGLSCAAGDAGVDWKGAALKFRRLTHPPRGEIMTPNAMMVGWGRPVSGREKHASDLFNELSNYLNELARKGSIQSFEPVVLDPHGGDLAGFFVVRGRPEALHELRWSEQWASWVMRGSLDLQHFGVVEAFAGDAVAPVMKSWSQMLQTRVATGRCPGRPWGGRPARASMCAAARHRRRTGRPTHGAGALDRPGSRR